VGYPDRTPEIELCPVCLSTTRIHLENVDIYTFPDGKIAAANCAHNGSRLISDHYRNIVMAAGRAIVVLSRPNRNPCYHPRSRTATIHAEAIIFDFDFTLADSSQGIVECVAYAFQELGLPIPPAERVMDTIGLSLDATFNRLTGLDGSDMARDFVRCFHERADQVMDNHTVVYECVRPLLELLRSANIRVGVVSTKLNYRIRGILQKNGLDSLFDTIVGADDVTKSKPDPEGLFLALMNLGVRSSAALYVGDHLIDGEAAQAAGVGFVAVLSGRHIRSQFEKVPHLAVLETVEQLPTVLGLGEK
jgi:phosphoglycolate phosphatase